MPGDIVFSHFDLVRPTDIAISMHPHNAMPPSLTSNDGLRNSSVGLFRAARSRAAETRVAAIAGGASGGGVLVLFALFFLVRYLRLRRATALELASWRTYQVAAVDFSNLKILQKIGEGGAGAVFKGDLNGTVVAVKTLRAGATQNASQLEEFRREVSMMRTLRHPNVVSLIGATFDEPRYIITEFMGHGSLDRLLHNDAAPLPMELRLRMALDMARGLFLG
ncbi:putative protein kinase [Paratrimastix pyriformis]|uniref:Protein kinase domain-containing protein n=1 Tax=Paratrimastix pyriformis TaxID=342808 RepID=A0ABQ8UFV9_9EUKA|nr:putative protein kinase [Paratrimastix pyriformis]